MATLPERRSVLLFESAINYAKVGGVNARAFPRPHTKLPLLAPSARAEIGRAEGGINPVHGRPIKRVAEHDALLRCVADIGNHEARFAAFFGGKRGVGQVQDGNRKNAKISVLEVNRFLQPDGS